MAKGHIINTNLLEEEEIDRIVSEVESLRYQSTILALEHGRPPIATNVNNHKQVKLPFDRMLMNQVETYGLLGDCASIRNITICEGNALKKVVWRLQDRRLLMFWAVH